LIERVIWPHFRWLLLVFAGEAGPSGQEPQ
jgi:hypothetical protein